MRKLFSILLLAIFGLPLVSPLLAMTGAADAGLPACCRRNGKHHCAMSAEQRGRMASHGPQFRAPVESCPYCPVRMVAYHSPTLAAPVAQAVFAGVASQPAGTAQAESMWRVARERSRGKRGPPIVQDGLDEGGASDLQG